MTEKSGKTIIQFSFELTKDSPLYAELMKGEETLAAILERKLREVGYDVEVKDITEEENQKLKNIFKK